MVFRSPRKPWWRPSECLEGGRVIGSPGRMFDKPGLTTETRATNRADRPRKPDYRQSVLDSRWPTGTSLYLGVGAACGGLAQGAMAFGETVVQRCKGIVRLAA